MKLKILISLILFTFISNAIFACRCSVLYDSIHSVKQFKYIDFIAHVKIIEESEGKTSDLKIEIIELFKGKISDQIIQYGQGSSCDIGISKGEEWILFATKSKNNLEISFCGGNKKYKNKDEVIEWNGLGFYKLSRLQELYKHPKNGIENGLKTSYYSNGQKEFEAEYINGKLSGTRKIWYPNGVILGVQNFINDTLNGKADWYYPSGNLYRKDFYSKGKRINVSTIFWDSSKLIPMVLFEYDNNGFQILMRDFYDKTENIYEEEFTNPDDFSSTIITYYMNGKIASLHHTKDFKNFGHHYNFDENGNSTKGWDYDNDGEKIKTE